MGSIWTSKRSVRLYATNLTCYILVAMANDRYQLLWYILGKLPFRVLELHDGNCSEKDRQDGHKSAEEEVR